MHVLASLLQLYLYSFRGRFFFLWQQKARSYPPHARFWMTHRLGECSAARELIWWFAFFSKIPWNFSIPFRLLFISSFPLHSLLFPWFSLPSAAVNKTVTAADEGNVTSCVSLFAAACNIYFHLFESNLRSFTAFSFLSSHALQQPPKHFTCHSNTLDCCCWPILDLSASTLIHLSWICLLTHWIIGTSHYTDDKWPFIRIIVVELFIYLSHYYSCPLSEVPLFSGISFFKK